MMEPEGDDSSEFMAFKQRKREIQLAVNLVTKLAGYPDDQGFFLDKIKAEAVELSESPLGESFVIICTVDILLL
jgi:hypothetical protein